MRVWGTLAWCGVLTNPRSQLNSQRAVLGAASVERADALARYAEQRDRYGERQAARLIGLDAWCSRACMSNVRSVSQQSEFNQT
jgi:hypothetical protein